MEANRTDLRPRREGERGRAGRFAGLYSRLGIEQSGTPQSVSDASELPGS
jgi:hypothetical protein